MLTSTKAQSAMEYLMTYGWAILIIAVVLGALFSIGVFGGSSFVGTSCVASPGFYCGGITYSHSTGNMVIMIGQNTGALWGTVAFLYAPQGTASTVNAPSVMFANALAPPTGFYSGQIYGLYWPVSAPGTAVGATTSGAVWACYTIVSPGLTSGMLMTTYSGSCTAGTNTVYYAQMATLTAKAS